jgi:hypothetical protein
MRSKCAWCDGTDLMEDALSAHNGVVIGRDYKGQFEWVLVRCSICLTCGGVFPYVDDMAVAQLRTWRESVQRPGPPAVGAPAAARPAPPAREAPPSFTVDGAAPDGAPAPAAGPNFTVIVIIFALIGVLFGVLAIVSDLMK